MSIGYGKMGDGLTTAAPSTAERVGTLGRTRWMWETKIPSVHLEFPIRTGLKAKEGKTRETTLLSV